jgi:hypothetical protein
VVAGLHGLLLLALGDTLLPRLRDNAAPATPQPMVLHLIAPLPSAAPVEAPRAVTQPTVQVRSPRASRVEPGMAPVGPAITAEPTSAETPPAASAPAAQPLNLSLPRAIAMPPQPSLRDQMFNDRRSNTPHATIETRVADVAGTVDMVEERMDATRLRVKQRGSCIEVHESRDAQINPWNQSHSPTPKIVKPSC